MKMSRVVRVTVALLSLFCVCVMSGCASPMGLPSGGSVHTLAPVEPQTRRVFTDPQGPAQDAQPESIVKGFFDAMPAGVQHDGYHVAKQFLTASAAASWDGDAHTVVYTGIPQFVRKANTLNSSRTSAASLIIEVDIEIVGTLDEHGLYQPAKTDANESVDLILEKSEGQWRITNPSIGVIISDVDFGQIFRQVSLYQLANSGKMLVPDVRWFGWRKWRTQAVKELLLGAAPWLGQSVEPTNTGGVKLAIDAVPFEDGKPQVRLSDDFLQLDEHHQSNLVRQIRLTLSDGSTDSGIRVFAGANIDFSQADADSTLSPFQPNQLMYSLSSGHIVSLGSSSPLRVGETDGFAHARAFVYSSSGGAVLREDGVAECITADGNSCGVLFDGEHMATITAGLQSEVWGLSSDGMTLYVAQGSESRKLDIHWLGNNTITALSVSSEGSRLALSIQSGSLQGVVLAGISRDGNLLVKSLSDQPVQVSYQSGISMLTFYNDTTLVYAGNMDDAHMQKAYRQLVPGPAENQKLPSSQTVMLSSGQVSMSRRLAALDEGGTVRSISGSLDGSWSIADSQVTAISGR